MAEGDGLIIKIVADAKEFASGVSKAVSDAKGKFKGLGDELAKELKRVDTVGTTAFNGITGAIGVMAAGATAAIGGLVSEAVNSYADFEQLEGGIKKLFGTGTETLEEYMKRTGLSAQDAAEEMHKLDLAYTEVMDNADNAYKTVGMSANEYMQNVTGFSAALINSLGGDTQAAAEMADMAMRDIADNANTYGKYSAEELAGVYQALAKGTYTTLDNLNLGFGGSKEGMEALIRKAEELDSTFKVTHTTGKNGADEITWAFDDMVKAIHIVQTEMKITGTTEREAAGTISGSLSMVKASWENLKTAIIDADYDIEGDLVNLDDKINALVESMGFYIDNLMPAIQKALDGIGNLIIKMAPIIIGAIPELVEKFLPKMIESVKAIADTLGTVIKDNLGGIIDIIAQTLPGLIEVGVGMVESILQGLSQNTGKIKEAAPKIIHSLADGMRSIMKELLPIAQDLIGTIAEGFIEYKTLIFEMGIQIITTLIHGLADAAPQLAPQLVDAVLHLLDVLIENLPTLIDAAVKIITELTNAIMEKLPELLGKVGKVVYDLCNKLLDNLPELLQDAVKIVAAILALVAEILLAALISIGQHLAKWWNETVKPWLDNMGKKVSEWWDGMKKDAQNKLDKIKEVVKGIVDMLKTDVKNKIEEIKTNVGEKVEAIKTKVSETVSNIKTAVSEKVADIKSGISEKVSSIKTSVSEKVTDIKTKVVDTVSSLKTSISDKISAIKTNITTKVDEIKTNIKNKVSSIKETIVTTIQELPGKMLDIGKNIVEGLWNGIGNAKEWLKGKISDLVGDVTGWFKDKLGINSPSKVFAEFGKYMTEGLAVGMDKETDMLKNTAVDQISQLTKLYDGINLGIPRLAGAGQALAKMRQSIQTVNNDNGNVFNFYQTFEGAGADTGEAMFRQFQRKVRYAGGIL